jgi:hypothetical protein
MRGSSRHGAATIALALAGLVAGACGDDDPSSGSAPNASAQGAGGVGSGAGASSGAGAGGSGSGGGSCHADPGPDDKPRHVVIGRPYDGDAMPSDEWELLALDARGVLTRPGTTFSMGRAPYGVVSFTPDGAIGVVAQDDGTLGVFRRDDHGVEVVHERFEGQFYAESVVVAASGAEAYVLDAGFPENGGGIYRVAIACDGTLTDLGRMIETQSAWRMALTSDPTEYLVGATSVARSRASTDAHLVTLGAAPSLVASADAFGDDEAIVSAVAITHDGLYGLVGDNSAFSGVDNRVAVVAIEGAALGPVQVLAPLEDPAAIVESPFGGTLLVTSGFGDAIFEVSYTPLEDPPFHLEGEIDYTGDAPQIPVDAVMVARGSLEGHVLVAEVGAVRQLAFAPAGLSDGGRYELGAGTENIVGAIGVVP